MEGGHQTRHAESSIGRCPVHPDEPLTGLCSCGTFFCHRCSPSAVFCARCYQTRVYSTSFRIAAGTSLSVSGACAATGRVTYRRPLAQRILIEALLLIISTILIMGGLLFQQSRTLAASDGQVFGFGINAGNDPQQKNAPYFSDSIKFNDATVTLTSDTSYSISARVQSVHAYDDMISPAIPDDLLLSWGKLADPDTASRFSWKQSGRHGTISGPLDSDLTSSYIISHVSNNHLIPANDSIRAALSLVKPGDLVHIDGRLVDARMVIDNTEISVQTSKSRADQGDGACEIIYVEHLRVNGQSF